MTWRWTQHACILNSMKHGRITHFQQLSTSPSTCCFPMGFFFAHIAHAYLICGTKPSSQKRHKNTLEATRTNFQFFTQVRIFTWFTSDFTAETTSPKDLRNADFMEVSFGCLWGWRSCKAIFWVDTGGMLRSDIWNSLHMTRKLASITSNYIDWSGGVGPRHHGYESKNGPLQKLET